MKKISTQLIALASSVMLVAGLVPAPALAEVASEVRSVAEDASTANDGAADKDAAGNAAADADEAKEDTEVKADADESASPQTEATAASDSDARDATSADENEGATEDDDAVEDGDAQEAADTDEASARATVAWRLADEGEWKSVSSLEEADKNADADVAEFALTHVELSLEGTDATIEMRTRAADAEWPDDGEWPEAEEDAADDADADAQNDSAEKAASKAEADADESDADADDAADDAADDGAASDAADVEDTADDAASDASEQTAQVIWDDAAFEEFQARLVGTDELSVWYRVHAGERGWLGWAKDAEPAGTKGLDVEVDGLQLLIVSADEVSATEELLTEDPEAFLDADDVAEDVADEESEDAKDNAKADKKKSVSSKKDSSDTALTAQASVPTITYQAHVQTIGWQDSVTNGGTAGTSGRSLRMEALRVSLPTGTNGGVTYQAHVQRIGWQNWASNGQMAGTSGRSLRVEGFKMKLTGAIAKQYDIYYRTHIQRFGWLKWAKNGEATGSEGLSLRMEALQIVLVAKGGAAPSSSNSFHTAFVNAPTLQYRGHVQSIGWQDWVSNGQTAGTSGRSLRVEALETKVTGTQLTGEVQMNAHVQSIGWQSGWSTSCGTSGRSLRVEAFKARLTGDLANYFDIYYRVHAQRIGWMGWATNGQEAGTSAMSLRLEAVEMRLVPKGSGAPGSTSNRYIDGNTVGKMGYQNPAGFYQVSSKNVTITSAATYPWNYVTPSRIGVWASRQDCVNAFIARAREYLGTPYVWDYSCAPGVGVDCIGLVFQCAYACGMDLGGGTGYDDFNPWAHWTSGSSGWHSHDANNFWDYGKVMHVSLSSRQRGDLISWAGHVAIYLGDDQIIEAYPGSVMYNSLWAHGTPRGCMRLFQ